MLQVSNLKLIALAAIYVLHVTFCDSLMGKGFSDLGNTTLSVVKHSTSSKSNPGEQCSYRLLTKHEQSKQALVSLPNAVDFVSTTFTGFIAELVKQPLFGAFAQLNTFKLYRQYRVFLI